MEKNEKFWCWWLSRTITYIGLEGMEEGYNTKTKDYTPRHYYAFRDGIGVHIRIYDEQLDGLKKIKA